MAACCGARAGDVRNQGNSDSLSKELLSIKSIFVGPRFGPFVLGAIAGVLAFRCREPIVDTLKETFDAVLGKAEQPAWALQSGVALALIAVVVLIVKPDLLDHIKSVKAGGFEATFVARSATVRTARLENGDLTEKLAISLYSNYERDFLGPAGPRGRAREWFDQLGGLPERFSIATTLFQNYVEIVIKSVICLDENDVRRMALDDPDLIAYAATWQRFILDLNDGHNDFSEAALRSVLEDLRARSMRFADHVTRLAPKCETKIKAVARSDVSPAADAGHHLVLLHPG